MTAVPIEDQFLKAQGVRSLKDRRRTGRIGEVGCIVAAIGYRAFERRNLLLGASAITATKN